MKSIVQEMVELLKKVKDVEQAATMLVEKAYDKGFDNGVSHAKLGLVAETDQQKRDRIVKQAKEFVEKFTNSNIFEFSTEKFPLGWWAKEMDGTPSTCKSEFIVNKEKRTVVCLIKNPSRNMGIRSKGFAKCDPNDCFNEHIGKAIALHRALGLDVPQEYLDVPNPTELRFGNVVAALNDYPGALDGPISKGSKFTVVREISYRGSECQIKSDIAENSIIIDDSESEPNV